MSCKYCNLKRMKDGDVEWIAGEEWGSESDDGGYICPHDNGFRMLVYYDARCACAVVDNIKYCPFCGSELKLPKEPLIKDEKIRKAVRAWAKVNKIERLGIQKIVTEARGLEDSWFAITGQDNNNCLWTTEIHASYSETVRKDYKGDAVSIAELCGEEEE